MRAAAVIVPPLRRGVWREARCGLRLPAARALRLKEAVTVVPPGLWAEILSLRSDRLLTVLFHAARVLPPKKKKKESSSSPRQQRWDGGAGDGSAFPQVSVR